MNDLSPCIPFVGDPLWTGSGFPPLTLGSPFLLALIQVHGLTSRPELNGKTGQIVARWWFQIPFFSVFSWCLRRVFVVQSAAFVGWWFHVNPRDFGLWWVGRDFSMLDRPWNQQVGFDAQKGRYSVLVQGGHGLGSAPTSVLEVSLQGRNCILKTGNLSCAGPETPKRNPEMYKTMWELWRNDCQVCWYKAGSSCAQGQFGRDRSKHESLISGCCALTLLYCGFWQFRRNEVKLLDR